jgi:hypothetical protein
MADKRISQLVDRGTVVNSDVVPIVVSGAVTTNKATISSIQTFMQGNLDLGVTSVGITLGSTGTDVSVSGSPVTSSGNITINLPTASATNRGLLSSANWSTFNSKVSSVGLSMPSAFTVANSPITGSGTIAVTGAGTVSQYVRGDGSLADFPQGGGGGGASVSYYLNGSVSQGTVGGVAYLEMNKTPILGVGTDFTIAADGYIASFITDAGDPGLLEITAGNWNFETYFQASSGGGSPSFYIELYKVSGTTATLIASSSANPELIAFGTSTTPYFSALAVPTTVLTITDRLAIRYYVVHSGRTITLHTENSNLCQVITTFTTGLTALNGLTAQVQNFATGSSGTDFNISSSGTTHTFNIPSASADNRGLITTGSQTIAGAKTFSVDAVINGVNVGRGGGSVGTNTRLGFGSLGSNTSGAENTSVGYLSLQNNTVGGSNTVLGYGSMAANTSGSQNIAIGNTTLVSNTTGNTNIAIGGQAGRYTSPAAANTNSSNSIFIGYDTRALADSQANQIVIGHNAIGNGSNTVTLGNDSITNTYLKGMVNAPNSVSILKKSDGFGGFTSNYLFLQTGTSTTTSGVDGISLLSKPSARALNVRYDIGGVTYGAELNADLLDNSRTYQFPNASGTFALTSNLSAYLPLAGGTLTGGLGGTSASFSSDVQTSTRFIAAKPLGEIRITPDLSGTTNRIESLGSLPFSLTSVDAITLAAGGTTPQITLATTGAVTLTGALNGTSASFSNTLSVANNASNQQVIIEANRGTGAGNTCIFEMRNTNATSNKVQVSFGGGTVASGYGRTFSFGVDIGGVGVKDFFVYNGGTSNTPFIITPNDRVIIGNTGISYSDLGYKLDVLGTARVTGAVTLTGALSGTSAVFSGAFEAGRTGGSVTSGDLQVDPTSLSANVYVGRLSSSSNDNTNFIVRNRIGSELFKVTGNTGAATFSSSVTANGLRLNGGDSTNTIYAGSSNMGITSESGYNIFIGRVSNTTIGLNVNTSTGNVGIGTASPTTRLDVRASVAGTVVEVRNERNAASGDYGFVTVLGSNAINTNSYHYIAGTIGGADRLYIYGNGNVVNVNNSYGSLSDIKLKENIQDASPKLDDLMKVKVRNYNLIGEETKQIGVIAQELEEVFPSMVDESEDFEDVEVPQLDEEGNEVLNEEDEVVTTKEKVSKGTTTKSVKYSVFVPMLIKAIQELKAEIDSLKNQIK